MAGLVDLVIHAKFVVRQRGLATPAVCEHLEAFVDQALVMQLLESPKHALGIGLVESLVVVVEVDPASLAGYVGAPVFCVLQHGCAAVLVELVNAELLNFGAARDLELAFCLYLGGESVGVPAETTFDAVSLHCLEARNHVFGVAGKQVSVVRQAVGKGRAVVKDEFFGVFGFAQVDAGLKSAVFLPVGKHLLLKLWKARAWVYALAGRIGVHLWIHE